MEEEKVFESNDKEIDDTDCNSDINFLKETIDNLRNELNLLSEKLEVSSKLEEYRKNLYEYFKEYQILERRFHELTGKVNLDKIKNIIDLIRNEKFLEKLEVKNEKEKENIKKVRDNFSSFKNAYGAYLENLLKTKNLTLKGNYPDFKISFFTVRAKLVSYDSGDYECTIWYGPKKEKISDSSMVPSKLVEKIEEILKNLGLNKPEEDIFSLFKEIYLKMSEGLNTKEIPIINFYEEVVKSLKENLKQSSKGKKRDSFKYSKADFSFDLYRLRKGNFPIKLRIATREFTKRRNTHLWVPSDDKGNGSNYSHISILNSGGEIIES